MNTRWSVVVLVFSVLYPSSRFVSRFIRIFPFLFRVSFFPVICVPGTVYFSSPRSSGCIVCVSPWGPSLIYLSFGVCHDRLIRRAFFFLLMWIPVSRRRPLYPSPAAFTFVAFGDWTWYFVHRKFLDWKSLAFWLIQGTLFPLLTVRLWFAILVNAFPCPKRSHSADCFDESNFCLQGFVFFYMRYAALWSCWGFVQ